MLRIIKREENSSDEEVDPEPWRVAWKIKKKKKVLMFQNAREERKTNNLNELYCGCVIIELSSNMAHPVYKFHNFLDFT